MRTAAVISSPDVVLKRACASVCAQGGDGSVVIMPTSTAGGSRSAMMSLDMPSMSGIEGTSKVHRDGVQAITGRFLGGWPPTSDSATQQPCPESGRIPRISAVQHDLLDAADRALAIIARPRLMENAARAPKRQPASRAM